MPTHDTFAEALAAPTPTPGGGAAAARVGCFACSLIRMVTGITLSKIDQGKATASQAARTALETAQGDARDLSERFTRLEAEDMAAFEAYLAAFRLPRSTESEKAERRRARRQAAARATEAPLAMLEAAHEVLQLCGKIVELSRTTPLRAESDLAAAVELADAAYRVAQLNVQVNLPELDARDAESVKERWNALKASLDKRVGELRAAVG